MVTENLSFRLCGPISQMLMKYVVSCVSCYKYEVSPYFQLQPLFSLFTNQSLLFLKVDGFFLVVWWKIVNQNIIVLKSVALTDEPLYFQKHAFLAFLNNVCLNSLFLQLNQTRENDSDSKIISDVLSFCYSHLFHHSFQIQPDVPQS